ncbi:hypothetical protein [Geomesophilobacter sediminis]|uniref:Uncharacterized protein n=1 Tax=Geomesophilobacter sediminis TaxID=2798584 RepID=A0A8J7JBA7_9BACT|nr:hypothetical protein [Geomesophilobacter sediminis]MBJ6723833.1 hypothetical protein [Geomesophilobacter sediminis]
MDCRIPKWLGIFTGLCIVMGIIGVLTNLVFLVMSLLHGSSIGVVLKTSIFWLSLFHVIRDGGLVYGGVEARGRQRAARYVIYFCAGTSLLELIYNTVLLGSKGSLIASITTIGFFVVPAAIQVALLYYFSKSEVKAFLSQPQ